MPESIRRALAASITAGLVAIVAWGLVVGEPVAEDRVAALGSQIKCPVCQGESIVDSPAGFARDMVSFVEEKIDDGWTDEEILVYLENRFPGTRLNPGFTGTSLILWALPAAVAAGGIVMLAGRTRRSSEPDANSSGSSDATVGETP